MHNTYFIDVVVPHFPANALCEFSGYTKASVFSGLLNIALWWTTSHPPRSWYQPQSWLTILLPLGVTGDVQQRVKWTLYLFSYCSRGGAHAFLLVSHPLTDLFRLAFQNSLVSACNRILKAIVELLKKLAFVCFLPKVRSFVLFPW